MLDFDHISIITEIYKFGGEDMAYSVDGKIYTEHALMDEIVYNIKRIFKDIVVKNDFLADQSESQLSVDNFDIQKLIRQNNVTFDNFPFTAAYYKAYGLSSSLIDIYVYNRYEMPLDKRDDFLAFCLDFYNENFEEANDYYRTLMGLPPYNTGNEYYITYNGDGIRPGYGEFIPTKFKNTTTTNIDESLPLHLQNKTVIGVIQTNGGIDTLADYYKGSKYSYIKHLGNKAIDWYTARIASKYDILYMPKVEQLVQDSFLELYGKNKEIYLSRTYQDAYKYESDYFEQEMILMILCQTFADIITETPEWYIRRDIFDLRSVKYFLDSYGVDYFPEIPLKYQIRIVKNLNTLIKFKSSNRNNFDIVNIFDLPEAKFYKYYLFKRRRKKGENYIHSTVNNKNFNLQFIKSQLGDTYDNYIKDNLYQVPYNDITLDDKYWDGETEHKVLRNKILEKDFTIEGTKYMSIEYDAPMSDYADQMQFFLGTILNSNFDMDDFTVVIPTISEASSLRVSDLFLLLIALSDIYEASEQVLRYPDDEVDPWEVNVDEDYKRFFMDLDGGYAGSTDDEFEKTVEGIIKYKSTTTSWWINADGGEVKYSTIRSADELNTWMKYWYDPTHTKEDTIEPWMYETRKNYIHAFNEVDLDKLSNIISQRHSRYGFEHGYTLEDIGVAGYISPSEIDINSADELIAYYKNNISIYNDLKTRLAGRHYSYNEDKTEVINSLGYDEHKLLEFVFNTLFTKEFDYDLYRLQNGELATSFGDILLERDYIIYELYTKIKNDNNKDTQRDYIRNILNDIINTLEYYLNGEGLEYIFSFTAIASFDALLRYIYLTVNFFKSWKVHFIDPFVTFKAADIVQNAASAQDGLREIKEEVHKPDKLYSADVWTVRDIKYLYDYPNKENNKELVGVSAHFEPDPFDDYDYDGMAPRNDDDSYKMADGAYPDDKSQFPYKMLNGGDPQLGMFGSWDLNGYGPKEYDDDYIDINGGYPYHKDDDRTDWFGTLGFNYVIDGGDVTFADYIGRTLRLDLHDHQIYADVRVSDKLFNVLKISEDGLIIEDDWVSLKEFTTFVDTMANEYRYYSDLYSYFVGMIEDIYDEDLLDQRIANTVDKYTKTILEVADDLEDDDAKNKIKSYVDTLIKEAFDRYKDFTALGTWGSIDETASTEELVTD